MGIAAAKLLKPCGGVPGPDKVLELAPRAQAEWGQGVGARKCRSGMRGGMSLAEWA
jgi:hypothetical protein